MRRESLVGGGLKMAIRRSVRDMVSLKGLLHIRAEKSEQEDSHLDANSTQVLRALRLAGTTRGG